MRLIVLKEKEFKSLRAKVRQLVRKVHNGEVQFNATNFVGFFGDKGCYQSYDVKFKSKAIHESEVAVSVCCCGNEYRAYVRIDDMQGVWTYSKCDFK